MALKCVGDKCIGYFVSDVNYCTICNNYILKGMYCLLDERIVTLETESKLCKNLRKQVENNQ